MNIADQIKNVRNQKAKRYAGALSSEEVANAAFKFGFDEAMGLDLPIKFLHWQIDNKYVYEPSKDVFIAAWDNYKEFTGKTLYREFLIQTKEG